MQKVYQWETVGNSPSKSVKAVNPSIDIKFDVLSTMPLSCQNDMYMLLWRHYEVISKDKVFYFFPSGHGNEFCNLIGS